MWRIESRKHNVVPGYNDEEIETTLTEYIFIYKCDQFLMSSEPTWIMGGLPHTKGWWENEFGFHAISSAQCKGTEMIK